MEIKTNIKKTRTLKDFTRILIGFVCALFVLSMYQQFSLFHGGVIDRPLNRTLLLLLVNHLGFAAVLSFVLLLVFRFLERSKPGTGFRGSIALFSTFLLFEVLLIENFIRNYSMLHITDFQSGFSLTLSNTIILKFVLVILGIGLLYFLFYKLSAFLNPFIGKMYPFTIILFLLALSTSVTEKSPINQNKTLSFISETADYLLDFNTYEGKEYPLLKEWEKDDLFVEHFTSNAHSPNIVIVVWDGLRPEFLREGKFAGFTPFLDSITQKSLYWNRFLANSTSTTDAVTNILGSLPQGENGFMALENSANRNTLFGLLKQNNYNTGFYFGGNASLNNMDRFLNEEQVDIVLDKSRFSNSYVLQEADRAGVTLGYPDGELYKKWGSSYFASNQPKIEFFLNLSTTKPFSIPDSDYYESWVEKAFDTMKFDGKQKRFVKKNVDLFAAMNYTDDALGKLFKMYALTKDAGNTIFVVTGSGKNYLPIENPLQQYQVPLVIYSTLLKQGMEFNNLASHHDIAPSLLSLLRQQHGFELPQKSAWLGNGLLREDGKVVLSIANNGVKALVYNGHFVKGRKVAGIGDTLELLTPNDSVKGRLKKELKFFKAINSYVTKENKILPRDLAVYESGKKQFTKEEMVWISSVFNGRNYDNAYNSARELAHDGNYDKALLLSAYILDNVPGHIDALILQGRIHAWKKHYNKSIMLLEKAVDLHPFYQDAYGALLDVYYWSGNNSRASRIYEQMKENNIETVELIKKVERCMNRMGKIQNVEKNQITGIQFQE